MALVRNVVWEIAMSISIQEAESLLRQLTSDSEKIRRQMSELASVRELLAEAERNTFLYQTSARRDGFARQRSFALTPLKRTQQRKTWVHR